MHTMTPSRSRLRTIIADDEALARRAIRRVLGTEGDVDIVGESADGVSALEQVKTLHPDLVFLDIRMPGMSGVDLLRSIPADQRPFVVFVSAYDEYAVRAFELHAADYLLKPIDQQRLLATLHEVRSRRQQRLHAERFDELLEQLRRIGEIGGAANGMVPANLERRYASRLIVRAEGRMIFVPTTQIDYIEANRNLLKVFAGGQTHVIREALGRLEKTLDPQIFTRIHRSTIVNISRVREVQPIPTGDYIVVLHNGNRLRMSRGFRGAFDGVMH